MKSRQAVMGLILLSTPLSFALAQSEPGQVATLAPEVTEEAAFAKDHDAEDELMKYIKAKGWGQPGIVRRANGCPIIVQIGVGIIGAPVSAKNYISARQNAFERAMLNAKANMAKTLEQVISVAVSNSVVGREGGITATPEEEMAQAVEGMSDDSVLSKARRLVKAKLDNALKKEGVDIAAEKNDGVERYQAAREKAKALFETSDYRKQIESSAACAVSGMQVFKIVEVQDPDKQGEIGVIAIWSPASAEMAASLVNGRRPALKAAKKSIAQQIPTDPKAMLSTFGVQQLINERGELVLVSYAQAGAYGRSKSLERTAKEKAQLNAEAQIRQYVGEMVTISQKTEEAERTLDYGNDLPDYSNLSSYQKFQQSCASAMKINGISTEFHRIVHPLTGKTVFIAISQWSNSHADAARAVKRGASGMRDTPPVAPISSPDQQEVPAVKKTPLIGFGADGDDDAF